MSLIRKQCSTFIIMSIDGPVTRAREPTLRDGAVSVESCGKAAFLANGRGRKCSLQILPNEAGAGIFSIFNMRKNSTPVISVKEERVQLVNSVCSLPRRPEPPRALSCLMLALRTDST